MLQVILKTIKTYIHGLIQCTLWQYNSNKIVHITRKYNSNNAVQLHDFHHSIMYQYIPEYSY